MAVLYLSKAETVLNSAGTKRSGGLVNFYTTGTSSRLDTFSDDTLSTPNTNPVELSSAGRPATNVYLSATDYKVVVTNSDGTDSITVDPVHGGQGTSAISYTRTGTGTVSRTLQSRLGDVLSLKDYGAVGDGVTDDYAACAAAFSDAVNTSQRTVYAPTGTYMLSQTLNVSNVSLIGEGAVATTFKAKSGFTGSSILLLDDTTGGSGGVDSLYQNFRIHGNRSVLGSTVHALKLYGNVLYNQFSNIRINEAKGVGIYIDGKAGPVRPSLLTFTNVHVNSGDSHGLQILAGRNMNFTNCAFENLSGSGIIISGATETCSRIIVDNVWLEAVLGDGILIDEGDQIQVINPNVGGFGITASACYGYRVSGASSRRNRLVGGDFSYNASPNAASKYILIDGGDRHVLEDINVTAANLAISATRAVAIRNNLDITATTLAPVIFSNGRATIAGGSTIYLAPMTGGQSATQTAVRSVVSGYMYLSQLRMETTVNAGGTDTYGVTVFVNGSATAMAATTAAGGGVANDFTNEVILAPGDFYSLRIVTSATATTIPIDGLHVTIGARM